MEKIHNLEILIDMALSEDLKCTGDVTSDAIFSDEISSFALVSKEEGILCGIDVFIKVMNRIDPMIAIEKFFLDRSIIQCGDIIAVINGSVLSILKAERTSLNFLSHLSGIATKTSVFVKEADNRVVILDTRKTIPGYRELQKYAVTCGGGINHRMGLYDMVMIKDNHIDAAGGISAAVKKVREKWGARFRIEVEARNISEVQEALDCGIDIIMLDNMTDDQMKEAVSLVNGRVEIEASGNMDFKRIRTAAETGVNNISFGELTNSFKAFDFSLKKIT